MAKRTRRAKKLPGKRIALILNGGRWYVRRIRVIEHDLDRDEKVYRCDKPIGKDFDCLVDAADAAGVNRRKPRGTQHARQSRPR